MVNLFKSHINALEKVSRTMGGWTTSMGGLAIHSVMTEDDCKKMQSAKKHIETAIDILKKANQMR